MRVAAVNWEIRPIRSKEDFFSHAFEILEKCEEKRAELVVLPEYFSLELAQLWPDSKSTRLSEQLNQIDLDPLFQSARKSGLGVVWGSTFREESDQILNRSQIQWRTGSVEYQDKLVMTQFEFHDWNMSAGSGVTRLKDPRFGVAICYDCEFPELCRIHAESGVECLIVPAFTETRHGFSRVRFSCHARAIENQIFVVHSSLVGTLGREPVPSTYGTSAILAPPIGPFPADGVLAESEPNVEGIAVADLDFEALEWGRNNGDVRNWHDRHNGPWAKN